MQFTSSYNSCPQIQRLQRHQGAQHPQSVFGWLYHLYQDDNDQDLASAWAMQWQALLRDWLRCFWFQALLSAISLAQKCSQVRSPRLNDGDQFHAQSNNGTYIPWSILFQQIYHDLLSHDLDS